MSWMHNNMWVSFIPIMIIVKIEYTIPGKTSSLEFALFIKFIIFHKPRPTGHIFIWLFFIIFRDTISSRSGSYKLRNTLYTYMYSYARGEKTIRERNSLATSGYSYVRNLNGGTRAGTRGRERELRA